MKSVFKECKGKCPFCDSEELDYGVMQVEDEYVWYPVDCESCGKESAEYYNLEYAETGYQEPFEDEDEE